MPEPFLLLNMHITRLPTIMKGKADVRHSRGCLNSSLFAKRNRDMPVSRVDSRAGNHAHSEFCGSIWDWTKTRHVRCEQLLFLKAAADLPHQNLALETKDEYIPKGLCPASYSSDGSLWANSGQSGHRCP